MVKILETINENDYKKDILDYINKTTDILCCLKKSMEDNSYNIPLDDISTKLHDNYTDILNIYLEINN